MKDVFESTESKLDELEKQNELLKDQTIRSITKHKWTGSPKSSETTFVAPKTRFSEKKTQSKTLDTTFVVSKSKIDVESASKAKDKVVQIVLWVVDNGCSKHMTGDWSLLRNFIEKFMGTVRFGLGHNLFSVGQFCGEIEVAVRSIPWIESMQDELNQFERLQVWELVLRPEGKNIIALKWLWKNKRGKLEVEFKETRFYCMSMLKLYYVSLLHAVLKFMDAYSTAY
ncbi:hypothetical protein Tco_0018564 [Tanacetum coccineum]